MARGRDHHNGRKPIQLSVGRIVAGLVVVFIAYVCGRAAGILLDVNPYMTEISVICVVIVAAVWLAARHG